MHFSFKPFSPFSNFTQESWEHLTKTYGSGLMITWFVSAVVSPFASFEKAKEVEEFFASHAMPCIARTLRQSLERANINAKWVQSVQNENELGDAVKELTQKILGYCLLQII
ncbi:Aminopeptidase M1 [Glycine soja]|uniref:Aminopeptidase M1 n=1 Tax=Glycine soja TaxID=3848 RepID=A0A445K527_GLYSO|nr:Aminopeptidase M1 [Glycine soja]